MNYTYQSPFSTRYSSDLMKEIFSYNYRSILWRKLWYSLAKAEKEEGLNITEEQIKELEDNQYNIDYEYIKEEEKRIKHDVMAHIHAYGKVAPNASSIIHLGATSCYVTDNADIVIYRDALLVIKKELKAAMKVLSEFIVKTKDIPCLGYTHFQPAQLVTVGKRASLWLQDLSFDLEKLEFILTQIKFLGCRGTTGTEASFMDLFNNDGEKIDRMNRMIANDFGFVSCFKVAGQTYSRKLDSTIMDVLSSISQSAYKMADDIRLLQHEHQIEEGFGENQVGSSAMAYKQNPMHCERICSIARYVINDSLNASHTASTQWLERSLDDSAIRRISMPEAYLGVDSILRLVINVIKGLRVNEAIINKEVMTYLPFIATENIMMEATKSGESRQVVHEIIRELSVKANNNIKNGLENNLLDLLVSDERLHLDRDSLNEVLKPANYIGRSGEQALALVNSLKDILSEANEIEDGVEI